LRLVIIDGAGIRYHFLRKNIPRSLRNLRFVNLVLRLVDNPGQKRSLSRLQSVILSVGVVNLHKNLLLLHLIPQFRLRIIFIIFSHLNRLLLLHRLQSVFDKKLSRLSFQIIIDVVQGVVLGLGHCYKLVYRGVISAVMELLNRVVFGQRLLFQVQLVELLHV
jgi:hypothetical protein